MSYAETLCVFYPHKLLTQDIQGAQRLEYLYPESNQVVEVPNVWYNQPYTHRVAVLRDEAIDYRVTADELEREGLKEAANQAREVAGMREAAARWLSALGDPEFPVAIVR